MPSLKEQSSQGKNLMSQAASAWAVLSPERKRVFEAESQVLKTAAKGKAKEERRPLTQYNLFVKQRFSPLAAKNPTLKAKEIMALVAEEWKVVPESEKRDRKAAS